MEARKKILLVEDDEVLASVYRARLEMEDFEVMEVHDGEQALTAALKYRPDLMILDVMMPKISGFDVLDILRNTPETMNLQIIMLTALSQESDRERAEKLGVDEYLVKSQVMISDVIEKVREHLGIGEDYTRGSKMSKIKNEPFERLTHFLLQLRSNNFYNCASFCFASKFAFLDLFKFHNTVLFGMNREISAHVSSFTSQFSCTSLSNENFTLVNFLATKSFNTKALTGVIVDVLT